MNFLLQYALNVVKNICTFFFSLKSYLTFIPSSHPLQTSLCDITLTLPQPQRYPVTQRHLQH